MSGNADSRSVQNILAVTTCRCRLRLTAPRFLLDDCETWTLNASLTRSSSYRKCSKRQILGHSAQATSLLPIEGTTKCLRIARGFGSGSGIGFAAEMKPKAGFGWRARAAFTVLKPILCGNVITDDQRPLFCLQQRSSYPPDRQKSSNSQLPFGEYSRPFVNGLGRCRLKTWQRSWKSRNGLQRSLPRVT